MTKPKVSVEDVVLPSIQNNPEEYRKFCEYANSVFTNPFYELLRKDLVNTQMTNTVMDSRDYEAVQFGRATIAGILLWEEIFKKYSLQFEAKFLEKPADFNPSKGFQSVS